MATPQVASFLQRARLILNTSPADRAAQTQGKSRDICPRSTLDPIFASIPCIVRYPQIRENAWFTTWIWPNKPELLLSFPKKQVQELSSSERCLKPTWCAWPASDGNRGEFWEVCERGGLGSKLLKWSVSRRKWETRVSSR